MSYTTRVQRRLSPTTYPYYVLLLLFLLGVSNYLDRSILNILTQPIKVDFRLSDFEVGLLGGPAFALLYTFLGIPLARVAERGNRVNILTISMLAWSAMTALSGLCVSFIQLFFCRIGVGIGEAGAYPAIQSLLSDYFPPRRRATASSLQSLGIAIGGMLGSIVGGTVAEFYGWHAALLVAGLPGLLIAVVVKFTVGEPEHGVFDARTDGDPQSPPRFMACLRYLFAKRTYVLIVVGAAITNFASIGLSQFSAAYIVRRFGVPLGELGLLSGVLGGVAMTISMTFAGVVCDALGRRDVRWYVWVGALTLAITVPFVILGFTRTNWIAAVVFTSLPNLFYFVHHAAGIGLSQNLAAPRMRATAVAIYGFASAVLGPGLGPEGVGYMSDRFAAMGFAGDFVNACPHGLPPPGAVPALAQACLSASAQGIADAVMVSSLLYLVGAAFFFAAAFSIERDLGDAMQTG